MGKLMKQVLLVLVIIPLTSGCMLTKTKCKNLYERSRSNVYDAIIVPGIPYNGDLWSRIMKGRVYWAKHLFDEGIAKNIIFSGSSVYTPYAEGEIMMLYACEIGIPKENIFVEGKAEHSTENVYYSHKLAKKLGFRFIALATDPVQSRLLNGFVKRKVDDIDIIPFVIDILEKNEEKMIDPAIDASLAYKEDFISIVDRESKLKRFRGTLGKNINSSYYAEEPNE
jgi:uncharacterized SAM-binding protein YcdF (DUF218 family)